MEKLKEFEQFFLNLTPASQDYLLNMCQLAMIERNSLNQNSNDKSSEKDYDQTGRTR